MISLKLEDNQFPFEGFDHVRHIARGIVFNEDGKIALHHLHRNDAFGDQWYYETPGGGVDEEESYSEAFTREVKEEVGADVMILSVIGEVEDAYHKIKRKNLQRYFLARLIALSKPQYVSKGDTLIQETVWVSLEEALELLKGQDDTLVSGLVKQREIPIIEEVIRLRNAQRIAWPHQPHHRGTNPIHTKNLLLRRFEAGDAEAMFQNWAGDPEITEYLEWPRHANVEVTRNVLEVWTKKYRDPTFYQWAIVHQDSKELIGSISVIHSEYQAFEVGFCLTKRYWHQGLAKEALRAMLGYFFEEVGIRRVFGKHNIANVRAGMVMQACGMRLLKRVPNGGFDQHGICDVDVYEIKLEEHLAKKNLIW